MSNGIIATGQIKSTILTGTPPMTVESATLVENMYVARSVLSDNASSVDGANIFGNLNVDNITANNITVAGNLNAASANIALALATTGSPVNVSAASPGTTGQTLTLTSPTTATWQTPSSGGQNSSAFGMDSTGKTGGTTVLTNSSAFFQRFTGSASHTVTLPTADQTGRTFLFMNGGGVGDSLTVNSAGGGTVTTLPDGNDFHWVVANGTGTGASAWTVVMSEF